MRSLWSVAMIPFTKYHGCGNDFIILPEEETVEGRSCPELARQICHRTLGIGADGLIIVRKRPLEMVIYNSDGSRAPMCGNGIRCFVKYCYDEGICTKDSYPVETLAGTMGVKVTCRSPFLVEINMGKPDFKPESCGIKKEESDTIKGDPLWKNNLKLPPELHENFLKRELQLKDRRIEVSSCFMGTIHTVVWMENFDTVDLTKLGEEISNHPVYTEKTNVNMVRIVDRKTLRNYTYERGAGMTFACGTGACASVVIGALEERCDREADVLLPYGKLHIEQKPNDEVMMTGPAVKTGQGHFEEDREEKKQ